MQARGAAGTSTRPTLLLCVTLQQITMGWPLAAVDEASLVAAPTRGRDQAPGADPGGIGRSRCLRCWARGSATGRAQLSSTGTDANRWSQ
jgi:hypothetical protein